MMMEQQGEEVALIILIDDDCNEKAAAAAAPPPPPPRDWAALPRDVLLDILGRLRHADILGGAGLACAEWRRAAVEEPTLWRHIDLSFDESDEISTEARLVRLAMGRVAVDRSAGQCESFRCPADRDMLVYLADRAPCLRTLVTLTWCLPKKFSDMVIPKLPMLEHLELGYGHVLKYTLLGLLEHCPRLEVLDAGECDTDAHVELDVLTTFRTKLKSVRLPWNTIRCYCNTCFREDPPRCYYERRWGSREIKILWSPN